jgi:hypothetical protein
MMKLVPTLRSIKCLSVQPDWVIKSWENDVPSLRMSSDIRLKIYEDTLP